MTPARAKASLVVRMFRETDMFPAINTRTPTTKLIKH